MNYFNGSLAQFLNGGANAQQSGNNQPQFDINQFKQGVRGMNNATLNQLVLQARQQGINERDIQAGLSMINNMRR